MEKDLTHFNSKGFPRAKRKDGEYIYRSGRPNANRTRVCISVDNDLLTWLRSQGGISDYINSLIRKDMGEKSREV